MKEKSPHKDSTLVNFSFDLDGIGKAKGHLAIAGQAFDFQLSNMSNPLNDLLRGMSNMVTTPSHLWDEENYCWVDWFSDEMSYKWILSTGDAQMLNVKIECFTDLFDNDSRKIVLDKLCSYDSFFLAIVHALDKFIKTTGLLNYEQRWQKDEFPLTYLLFLKKHLKDRGVWKTEHPIGNALLEELDLLSE